MLQSIKALLCLHGGTERLFYPFLVFAFMKACPTCLLLKGDVSMDYSAKWFRPSKSINPPHPRFLEMTGSIFFPRRGAPPQLLARNAQGKLTGEIVVQPDPHLTLGELTDDGIWFALVWVPCRILNPLTTVCFDRVDTNQLRPGVTNGAVFSP